MHHCIVGNRSEARDVIGRDRHFDSEIQARLLENKLFGVVIDFLGCMLGIPIKCPKRIGRNILEYLDLTIVPQKVSSIPNCQRNVGLLVMNSNALYAVTTSLMELSVGLAVCLLFWNHWAAIGVKNIVMWGIYSRSVVELADEIKRAYKKLSLQFHPDKVGSRVDCNLVL